VRSYNDRVLDYDNSSDKEGKPDERSGLCMNCGKAWGLHWGWSCAYHVGTGSGYHSSLAANERFLTSDMQAAQIRSQAARTRCAAHDALQQKCKELESKCEMLQQMNDEQCKVIRSVQALVGSR
jgi:hypothetical protein